MRKTLLGIMPLFLAFMLIGCHQPKTTNLKGASPKTVKLIKKYNLTVVDKDYVYSKLGKGTKNTAKAILIDARPVKKFTARTIPTSINMPDNKFEEYYKQLANTPKDKELIVFCGGWRCAKSPKIAGLLKAKGHTNVKLYQAGEPEWTKSFYSEVGTSIVKNAMLKRDALLIDARPFKKYIKSTIPSAISIPDNEFDKFKGRLPMDKNTPIITFCGGYECTKSPKIAKMILTLGYTNVSNYSAGMPAWKKAGLATTGSKAKTKEKSTKKSRFFGPIQKGGDEGTVDGEWFLKNYKNLPENVQMVDVRGSSERKEGFIKGSIHVSIEENKPKEFISKLPTDGYIIFHCSAGGRSIEAHELTKDENFKGKAVYLDANIKCVGNDCEIKPNEPLDPSDW